MASRVRLDKLLVDKGLVESREKAARLILAGEVLIDGQRVDKAGSLIPTDADIELKCRSPYGSRGGEKLVHALEHFTLNVKGRVCMDVGSSTGDRQLGSARPGHIAARQALSGTAIGRMLRKRIRLCIHIGARNETVVNLSAARNRDRPGRGLSVGTRCDLGPASRMAESTA